MTKNKKKGNHQLDWSEALDKAFEDIKKALAKQTLLVFPDFNKLFDIHVDASDEQLGGVISQDGKPIVHFSHEPTEMQKNCTVGKRETPSVVETLKESRDTLLGHKSESTWITKTTLDQRHNTILDAFNVGDGLQKNLNQTWCG